MQAVLLKKLEFSYFDSEKGEMVMTSIAKGAEVTLIDKGGAAYRVVYGELKTNIDKTQTEGILKIIEANNN